MPVTHNILIITGAAPCVRDDIENLPLNDFEADYMAIGMDAVDKYLWPINFMATYHAEDIPKAKEIREAMGGNTNYKVISHNPGDGIDIVEPYVGPTGSSALCGALAGIRMGYRKIILCGCPLLEKKYVVFQAGWKAKEKQVMGIVKSLSGWTREFLGAPTKEWLGG